MMKLYLSLMISAIMVLATAPLSYAQGESRLPKFLRTPRSGLQNRSVGRQGGGHSRFLRSHKSQTGLRTLRSAGSQGVPRSQRSIKTQQRSIRSQKLPKAQRTQKVQRSQRSIRSQSGARSLRLKNHQKTRSSLKTAQANQRKSSSFIGKVRNSISSAFGMKSKSPTKIHSPKTKK